MQQVEIYPRYMAHQLRTNLSATIVGKMIQFNSKKHSILLQTDAEAKMAVEGLLPEHIDPQQFEKGKYYEVRGKCRGSREIGVQGWTLFGADFDMSSYNQMLNLATKQFRNIFYS